MKLSQLTSDSFLDIACEITPFVENIVTDKEFMETIGKSIDGKGLTRAGMLAAALGRTTKLIPLLLKQHRQDVYGILSALNGVTVEEIGKQNVLKTMYQMKEVLTDKEMLAFFTSFTQEESAE